MRKSITFSPIELSMITRAMRNPNYNLKVSDKDENRLQILARKFEDVLGPWYPKYRLTWDPKKKKMNNPCTCVHLAQTI